MDKLVDEKYGIMIYMKVEKYFFQDHNTAGYQRMLEKMNFE